MSPNKGRKQSAFTLVELSIVIVIIGLIVGGVLTGKDLIRAAELRSLNSDMVSYDSAVRTFKLKYDCIPGDCNKANSFGIGSNGDGNGTVGLNTELWQFWTHLGTARLISGSYSGVAGPLGVYDSVNNVNIPISKLAGIGYSLWSPTAQGFGGGINNWGKPFSAGTHAFIVGKDNNITTHGGAIPSIDAQSLDTKYDDGSANTGRVRSHIAYSGYASVGCTTPGFTDGTVNDFAYDLIANGNCSMIFLFVP